MRNFISLQGLSNLTRKLQKITLLLCFCLPVLAQQIPTKIENLTDDQVRQFLEKAQASGMTELQIEQAAMAQGATPTDVAKMRDRIAKFKAGQTKTAGQEESGATRIQVAETAQKAVTPVSAEASVEKKSNVFGASLFNNTNLTFEPNLRIPTPKGYILGPDDQLIIDIVGLASVTYKPVVSPEGTVRIENIAPVTVSGLSIEAASERIISRLRQRYEGLNVSGSGLYAQVTLGNIKSIRVTVTGEATKPGTYTLSSLSSAFNALYQAGGPSARGSYRNIEIIRDGRITKTIDLYDFLLRADQKDNITLRDQDFIRIPFYSKKVEIAGEVKNPAVFEMTESETLKDALNFAGGYTDQAYTASVNLRRNTPKEIRGETIDAEKVATFGLQSGDKVTVGTILNRYENRVEIAGAVFRPGEYAIGDGVTTVKDLIKKAEGLREDAFRERALIKREKDNLDSETISFDLGKLIKGEIADIPLKRQDVITIKAIAELREKRSVTVYGAVNNGGTFAYGDNMSVADLIVLAGGFNEGAIPNRMELARRVKDSTGVVAGQNIIQFLFEIDGSLRLQTQDAKFKLQPFDEIYVRSSPRYEAQKTAFVMGEVNYSGLYPIKDRNERITDLIQRAGGVKSSAFMEAARFFRNGVPVAINIASVLEDPSLESNLLVENRDSLFIPRISELVSIAGSVLNPNTVNFNKKYALMDYVTQAGGFNEKAVRRKIYVTYPNGIIDRTKSFLMFKAYPKIQPGTVITVPEKPKKERDGLSTTEVVALASAASSLTAIVITIVNALKP